MRQKSIAGFSIVQVMVALVIATIAGMAIFNFTRELSKGQKNVQASVEFDSITNDLNLIFRSNVCLGVFYETPAQKLTLPTSGILQVGDNIFAGAAKRAVHEIKFGDTSVVQAQQILDSGMTIDTFEITDAVYGGSSGGYNNFLARIVLGATKPSGSLGRKSLTAEFLVNLQTVVGGAADGEVVRCGVAGVGGATPPPGMTDLGSFYMDDNFLTLAGTLSGQAAGAQAINKCNERGARLCDVSQWVVACSKTFVRITDIPSAGHVCTFGGGGSPASYNRGNCQPAPGALQGWIPGGCAGDVYRCCAEKTISSP